jgi:ubiquinone/menaquinone biosynthesis C-methylase UbiE
MQAPDVKQFMRRQRWNASNAKAYDAYRWLARDRGWRAYVAALLGDVPPGATVLEVGAGTGYITAIVAALGYQVLGFDLSEAMLARARTTLARQGLDQRVRLWQGDAESVNLPDASVDAVISRWVLWTLPDPRAALAEAARLLKPGGTAAFIDGRVLPQGRLARWRGQVTDYLLTGRKPGWRDACYANFDARLPRLDAGQIADRLTAEGLSVLSVDKDVDRVTDGTFRRWFAGDGWTSHTVTAVKPA